MPTHIIYRQAGPPSAADPPPGNFGIRGTHTREREVPPGQTCALAHYRLGLSHWEPLPHNSSAVNRRLWEISGLPFLTQVSVSTTSGSLGLRCPYRLISQVLFVYPKALISAIPSRYWSCFTIESYSVNNSSISLGSVGIGRSAAGHGLPGKMSPKCGCLPRALSVSTPASRRTLIDVDGIPVSLRCFKTFLFLFFSPCVVRAASVIITGWPRLEVHRQPMSCVVLLGDGPGR